MGSGKICSLENVIKPIPYFSLSLFFKIPSHNICL